MSGDDDDKLFENYYYTPSLPSAYGGLRNLRRGLEKSLGKKAPPGRAVGEWLSGEDAYTLHKAIKRKFKRRKTIVSGPGQQFQADLIDVRRHAADNDGNTFILTVVDVFSRRAFAAPLKNKTGAAVAKALAIVFLDTAPKYLQTDKGKEFFNGEVERTLDRFNVRHFTTENENVKASLVERFNQTLRNALHRFFTKTGRERYVDVLSDVVEAYNDRYHRALGVAPNEVADSGYEDVWLRLYDPLEYFERKRAAFASGDPVRISKARTAFKRGFTDNWSTEIFYVVEVLDTSPITYVVRDWKGETIRGTFYGEELQKVREPTEYRIEEVLRRKKVRGRWMNLVKWVGYGDEFNQWIPESDVHDR
jgi:PAS domain-containing protein